MFDLPLLPNGIPQPAIVQIVDLQSDRFTPSLQRSIEENRADNAVEQLRSFSQTTSKLDLTPSNEVNIKHRLKAQLFPIEDIFNRLSDRRCHQKTIKIEDYRFPVWMNDKFAGNFCRRITPNAERLELNLESQSGGFDTAVVKRNSQILVDDLASQSVISSTIEVALDGTGKWWVGPKFAVKQSGSRGLDSNYENYVVENASKTPQQQHERLTTLGRYLGQTKHNGSVYKHYYKEHKTWGQFWAIRQNYRDTGTVNLKPILDMWRKHGLPNEYVDAVRVNVETSGEVSGTVKMSELNFPSW